MNSAVVYLDESGDLGWSLDAEYRNGGSSRHLTISAVIVPCDKRHLPPRCIKKIYQRYQWLAKEKKWALMTCEEKMYFAKSALNLAHRHSDICYTSITVYKPNVYLHIRQDGIDCIII